MGTTAGIECPAGHRRALALPATVPARFRGDRPWWWALFGLAISVGPPPGLT